MKANRFDGGLNTRVDPSLIEVNEAVRFRNIDNTGRILKSCLDTTLVPGTSVTGYFYYYKSLWFSSTLERSYVEYKDFLYYTEKDKKPMKHDGSRESLLGIVAPTVALVATQADPVATEKISDDPVDLTYTYTYYNSQDGVESAPAPLSNELALAADKVVDLTGFVQSPDIQVDMIRIYRIGDNVTSMTLVKEVDNSNSVVRDDTPSISLMAHILDSYDNQPPLSGLQYLVEAYGILFAALGDKLYFTIPGKPNYWPAANYLDFPNTITGILPVAEGILVQSLTKTDILTGTTIATFKVQPVSIEQGNVAHFSNAWIKGVPIWISKDGICAYAGGSVQVISKDKLGKLSLSVVNTAVYDETYYICLMDGTLLVMDSRFTMNFKDYKFASPIGNIAVFNDVLYARIGSTLNTMFTGNEIEFDYLSPQFTEDAHTNTKLYNNIYLRSDGLFTVRVYIDGEEVLSKYLTGNTIHDITPPEEKQRGSNVQFSIVGTGKVYEYEYKVVGRQNGR